MPLSILSSTNNFMERDVLVAGCAVAALPPLFCGFGKNGLIGDDLIFGQTFCGIENNTYICTVINQDILKYA